MFNALKKLILKDYYTQEEAQNRVNVFYAKERINENEYNELNQLIQEHFIEEEIINNEEENIIINNEIEEPFIKEE